MVIENDPLEANPDFLVLGDFGGWTQICDPVLSAGEFQLVKSCLDYDIYQRVRAEKE